MKKAFTVFLYFMLSLPVLSQRTIQMEYTNGVYRIPCVVNGANMKMIFDTGASVVSISMATAIYLYQNGFITDNDFKSVGQSSTASGEIVDHMKINIRDIEIGGMHLYNVEGVVIESLNAPLLLGQTAIQKLGSITIKGNQLIINSATPIKKEYAKGEIFKYYDYKIRTTVIIMELEANLYEYVNSQSWTANRKQKTAEAIRQLFFYIRRGEISYSDGMINCPYGTQASTYFDFMKADKKRSSYLSEAGYYLGLISKRLVDRKQYIE